MRILVAEDDEQLRSALARGLREEAYAVDEAADGEAALFQAAVNEYDALVLDILMPKRNGIEVCREFRRRAGHAPILLLTARDAVGDKIQGLDAGADDYLTKPFELGELLARLRALLRRRGDVMPAEIVVGDLVLDTRTQSVRRGMRPITVTTKEYAFLEFLARNAGRIVSRADITAHVWDDNHDPLSNLIEVYVSRLRQKIDDGERVQLLWTRRGAGYMLKAPDESQPPSAE